MKTYKIYLIRNGLNDGSLKGKYIGQTDEPLCEIGRRQLYENSHKFYYPEIDMLFSSPLLRCTETASIIYPDRQPIIMDDLIEYDFGEFEGQTAEQLKDDPDFINWLKGEGDTAVPFGESNSKFMYRICLAFEKIVDALMQNGITKAGIVTHGGVISTILSKYGIPEAPASSWRIPAGGGCAVVANTSIWSKLKKVEVMEEIPYIVKDGEDGEKLPFQWHYGYED